MTPKWTIIWENVVFTAKDDMELVNILNDRTDEGETVEVRLWKPKDGRPITNKQAA